MRDSIFTSSTGGFRLTAFPSLRSAARPRLKRLNEASQRKADAPYYEGTRHNQNRSDTLVSTARFCFGRREWRGEERKRQQTRCRVIQRVSALTRTKVPFTFRMPARVKSWRDQIGGDEPIAHFGQFESNGFLSNSSRQAMSSHNSYLPMQMYRSAKLSNEN